MCGKEESVFGFSGSSDPFRRPAPLLPLPVVFAKSASACLLRVENALKWRFHLVSWADKSNLILINNLLIAVLSH
jgi:hypothetical protein